MPATQISEKRLAANRANARKSTGPRTAAGKAAARGNARRTGAYDAGHRLPPRLEAHFRTLAEAATKDIADPQRRALTFELHMMQGHARLHAGRERALFNAGLEYGHGDEARATQWVLRQVGFIQALNRYAGWIEANTRRLQRALDLLPSEPAPVQAGQPTEPVDHPSQAIPATATVASGSAPSPAQPTPLLEGSNPLCDNLESSARPNRPSRPDRPAARRNPIRDFEGTNPSAPQPPSPRHVQPSLRVTTNPSPRRQPFLSRTRPIQNGRAIPRSATCPSFSGSRLTG